MIVFPRYELAIPGGPAKPSMDKLVSNAVAWLANGKSPVTVATHTTDQVSLKYKFKCSNVY